MVTAWSTASASATSVSATCKVSDLLGGVDLNNILGDESLLGDTSLDNLLGDDLLGGVGVDNLLGDTGLDLGNTLSSLDVADLGNIGLPGIGDLGLGDLGIGDLGLGGVGDLGLDLSDVIGGLDLGGLGLDLGGIGIDLGVGGGGFNGHWRQWRERWQWR